MTPHPVSLRVERSPLSAILHVRTHVLRPHFTAGQLAHFEGDDDPQTWHAGLWRHDELVGCVTMMRRRYEGPFDQPQTWRECGEFSWQLRGMAVLEQHRGEGHGARLLHHVLLAVCAEDPVLVWCNARAAAISLYERAGLQVIGERFEVPIIGHHVVMGRVVSPRV